MVRSSTSGTIGIGTPARCQQCAKCDLDDSPTCPGDAALTLALFDDGEIPAIICDFIGTTARRTQYESDGRPGYSFCDLNRQCNHFEHSS